jgi:hypothetical protein
MLELTFEINGRRVDASNVGDALEGVFLRSIESQIKSKLSSVRCPEHHQAPQIKAKGRSLDDLSFEVKSCCTHLVELVKEKLK